MIECYFKEDTLFLKIKKADKTLGVALASADLHDGDRIGDRIAELVDKLLFESYGITRYDLISAAMETAFSRFAEDSIPKFIREPNGLGDAETIVEPDVDDTDSVAVPHDGPA